jgi:hypothetical protein
VIPERAGNAFYFLNRFVDLNTKRSMPTLVDICHRWRPDIIVRESFEFAGAIAAEHLGLSHATVQVGFQPHIFDVPQQELSTRLRRALNPARYRAADLRRSHRAAQESGKNARFGAPKAAGLHARIGAIARPLLSPDAPSIFNHEQTIEIKGWRTGKTEDHDSLLIGGRQELCCSSAG